MVVPERIMIPWRSLSSGDSRSRLAISGGRLARVLAQPARTPNQAVQHSRPAARVRGKGGAAPDLAAPPSTRARQLGVHENAGSGVLSRLCAFGVTGVQLQPDEPIERQRHLAVARVPPHARPEIRLQSEPVRVPSRRAEGTEPENSDFQLEGRVQIPIVMRQVSTST